MTMFENSENILACSAVIGLCAFLLTLLAVPLCKKLAYRIGCIDVPKAEAHKQHGKTTPLLGGLAMACGWILTVLGGCLAFSTISFADQGTVRSVVSVLPELLVLTACAAAAALAHQSDAVDYLTLAPLYLRAPQAQRERERREKQNG